MMLEVLDREKKLGFKMAAMPAMVRVDAPSRSYVATYPSAAQVRSEAIPWEEGQRLRFCPPSARGLLAHGPGAAPSEAPHIGAPCGARAQAYPYRVLGGMRGLHVGQGVEVQWKMQPQSPFGWWYGHLEEVHVDAREETALAVVAFRHFPAESRWYRLALRFGDDEPRPCISGGYTGGLRSVAAEEARQWMRFFPAEPVAIP